MSIDAATLDGVVVVRLHGELDHHRVELLRAELEDLLAQHHYRTLVLSFRGVSFIDSSGLGLILGRYRTISEHGGRMALCDIGPTLQKLFELSGVYRILPVLETEAAAVSAVKGERAR